MCAHPGDGVFQVLPYGLKNPAILFHRSTKKNQKLTLRNRRFVNTSKKRSERLVTHLLGKDIDRPGGTVKGLRILPIIL